MNQDLTQSNLSITRDGVTINISGPAWLIKDVYDREAGNPIRVEQATRPVGPLQQAVEDSVAKHGQPIAAAIENPYEASVTAWPYYLVGTRVRYAGSPRQGVVDDVSSAPRLYRVKWDDGPRSVHLGLMLEKVDDEPQAEPTIETLAEEEPESKRRRGISRGVKNYWSRLTPEERRKRTEKMRAARYPNKAPATNAEQPIGPLAQQEPETSTQPKRRGGRVSKRVPVVMRNGKPIVFNTIEQLQVGQWCEVPCHRVTPYEYAKTLGITVSSRRVRNGIQRVERVQ